MKFDFDDILIVPEMISKINSRKEVNPYGENGMLPIMTAPMDTVVSNSNFHIFNENKIIAVLPRNNEYEYSYLYHRWYSYGLKEFEDLFIKKSPHTGRELYALIDVANGHMESLLKLAEEAKKKYKDKLVLMVGNIANPSTYHMFACAGVDYIRVGIGGGQGCFHENTLITTENGQKEICLIEVGEKVLTHLGTYEEVIGKTSFVSNEECIVINNEITSTKNHEYYVLHKKFTDIVNDDNIHKYAQWIEAERLTDDYFLLELE